MCQYMKKKSGSWWEGWVVGEYHTEATPDGLAIQLPIPNGPVQIYPREALRELTPGEVIRRLELFANLTE